MADFELPGWAQAISGLLATVGAVLGVISTWAGLTRDRPNLTVKTCWRGEIEVNGLAGTFTFFSPDRLRYATRGQLGIEVINAGFVTVYIDEVGVCAHPQRTNESFWRKHVQKRLPLSTFDAKQVKLPYALDPGRCATFFFDEIEDDDIGLFDIAKCAYARTEADVWFYSRDTMLKAVLEKRASEIGRPS